MRQLDPTGVAVTPRCRVRRPNCRSVAASIWAGCLSQKEPVIVGLVARPGGPNEPICRKFVEGHMAPPADCPPSPQLAGQPDGQKVPGSRLGETRHI